ncbi:MAG: tRNA (adenosine(37)-N6)-threonylcarbamoyltransferase complex transferase subunit TsaD [Candidatus Saccharibacteria bacterium]
MTKNKVRILGIETSCDETAVAVIENGGTILSNLVASQIDVHRRFGGVVPEVASRKHIEVIARLVDDAVRDAGLQPSELDAIAVTNGPGLIGALLVGVSFAKAYAFGLNKPLVAVNHLVAHIYANLLGDSLPSFPAVCLVVSGGHTSLLHMNSRHEFDIMGETRDDAAGEAFDKVARFLGLGYPGGPAIQQTAQKGTAGIYKLPRVFLDRDDFEFSFSGLKTSTMNLWNKIKKEGREDTVYDLVAEFQEALVEVLVEKTINAARKKHVKTILVAGGVAANSLLREKLREKAAEFEIDVFIPSPKLCTDNGAMVGCAGYYHFVDGNLANWDLNAYPSFDFFVNKTCG